MGHHAGADRASVRVYAEDDTFVLIVTDDGRGFDPSTLTGPNARGGFGLFSIREEVEGCGGRLTITSAAGRGTTLEVRIPSGVSQGSRTPIGQLAE